MTLFTHDAAPTTYVFNLVIFTGQRIEMALLPSFRADGATGLEHFLRCPTSTSTATLSNESNPMSLVVKSLCNETLLGRLIITRLAMTAESPEAHCQVAVGREQPT
ncbi:hypothetical protein E5D57_006620 [Metarhizium anisopliae]|nr:hypothetical protein E5D57_006620 [Metarhizium anisopliae]